MPPEWAARTGRRTALRVVEVVEGARRRPADCARVTSSSAVSGIPLGDAQSLQRLMFEEAIGSRMEITVLRNGALVYALAVPSELTDRGTGTAAAIPGGQDITLRSPVKITRWRTWTTATDR
jgi:hypothetical protein